MQTVFQIETIDNVATALEPINVGTVTIIGDRLKETVMAIESIHEGHKISLRDIKSGEEILKYGIVIGRAIKDIKEGSWVHLNCMCSIYDERSSHLDVITGAPTDIKYE